MNKKLQKRLARSIDSRRIVEISRSSVTDWAALGIPVKQSAEFLCMLNVDEHYTFNGFSLLRLEDIDCISMWKERQEMVQYVLARRHLEIPAMHFPIADPEVKLPHILALVQNTYPLVTIHREGIDDSVCYVGTIAALKKKSFVLNLLGTAAEWEGTRKFRYSDVTRVDFGGKYEDALWLYAQHLSQEVPAVDVSTIE